jgi:DNA-binding beta-propeller fold protein YncE
MPVRRIRMNPMKKILLFLLLLSATFALGQPSPFQLQNTLRAADPQGVAVDPTGNFFVAEAATGRVRKYNAAGQFLFEFGSFGNDTASFQGLKGLTLDPAGNVYTLELAPFLVRIQKFTAAGQFLKSYDHLSNPTSAHSDYTSIAVDSKGTIHVASRYGCLLRRLSATGQVLPVLGGNAGRGSGQLAEPMAVAIDRHDNIYIADLYGQRIQKFSPNWQLLAEFGSFRENIQVGWGSIGMAVDAGGNVYVATTLDGPFHKYGFFDKYNAFGQSVAKLTLNSHGWA